MKRIPEKFQGCLIFLFALSLFVGVMWLTAFSFRTFETKWSETKRMDGVSRVMMHEPSRYTILVEKTDGTVTQHYFGGNVPEIFHDVPIGQSMWMEYRTGDPGKRRAFDQLLAIHVHSVADINGARWNHGKFGHGETTVIE